MGEEAAGNVLQIEAWKKLADAEKRDRKLKRFTEYDQRGSARGLPKRQPSPENTGKGRTVIAEREQFL